VYTRPQENISPVAAVITEEFNTIDFSDIRVALTVGPASTSVENHGRNGPERGHRPAFERGEHEQCQRTTHTA
jgi:hypothetical protein